MINTVTSHYGRSPIGINIYIFTYKHKSAESKANGSDFIDTKIFNFESFAARCAQVMCVCRCCGACGLRGSNKGQINKMKRKK